MPDLPALPAATPPPARVELEPQPLSLQVLRLKYAQAGEHGAEDVQRRVALALAQAEQPDVRAEWALRFMQAQRDGFVPAGRILATAGTGVDATLASCFVQPVGDSVLHGEGGWPGLYGALAEAAETMRRGGGVGLDFSRIRPRGAWVAGTNGLASGPVPFMQVFDCSAGTVQSMGERRGAQMGVLRCDHPDIETFVQAKRSGGLTHFNLSVGVTDAFMQAVQADEPWPLVHAAAPGPALREAGAAQRADGRWSYRVVGARPLWQAIVQAAWQCGDPGLLFLDAIRRDNPLQAVEEICATNPCGEQPLPPYGGCCLGSVDLRRFVRRPFEPDAWLDAAALAQVCGVAVRMLDNALQRCRWPLHAQREEAQAKRRIGLGFTGLADALVLLGLRYDSVAGRQMAAHMAETMRDAAVAASIDLAQERGPFPLFDAHRHLDHESFASRWPAALRQRARVDGLRHSHLLAVAPAGSISLALADNASAGIEPVFDWSVERTLRDLSGGTATWQVHSPAWRLWRALEGPQAALPESFVTAQDLAPADHVAMVAAVAPYIDGGIAKTVNLGAARSPEDVGEVFRQAWRSGLKGLTVFRPNSVTGTVMQVSKTRSAGQADEPARIDQLDQLDQPGRPDKPGQPPNSKRC